MYGGLNAAMCIQYIHLMGCMTIQIIRNLEKKMSKGLFDRKQPCKNCPYRKDAPLALWHIDEFKKLLDAEVTMFGKVFKCHKGDGCVCVGWLMDQDKRRLPCIALRMELSKHKITPEYLDALKSPSPLFESIREMCIANFPSLKRYKAKG